MLLISTTLALGLIGQTDNHLDDINRTFLEQSSAEGYQIVRDPLEREIVVDSLSFIGRIEPRNGETCESVFGDHFKETNEFSTSEEFLEYELFCENQCWLTNYVYERTQNFKSNESKVPGETITNITRVDRVEDRAVDVKVVDEGLASCHLAYLNKGHTYSREIMAMRRDEYPAYSEKFWSGLVRRFDLSGNLIFWNARQTLSKVEYFDFVGLFGPERYTLSRKVYAATGP